MADKLYVCTDKRGVQYRDMAGRRRMAYNNGVPIRDIDPESILIPKISAEGKVVEDEKGRPVMIVRYGFKEVDAPRGRPAVSADKVLKDKATKGRGTAAEIMGEIT